MRNAYTAYMENMRSIDTPAVALEEMLTDQFSAEDAIVYHSFEATWKHTIVAGCPRALGENLKPYMTELADAADGALELTSTEVLHSTILAFNGPCVPRLQSRPIHTFVQGIHLRPQGIMLNLYATDNSLVDVRKEIAAQVGRPFDPGNRLAGVAWVSLARFTRRPPSGLLALVRRYQKEVFGQVTFHELCLYEIRNKFLLGAVPLHRYPL